MIEARPNEPEYARLPETPGPPTNRYGQLINLVTLANSPAEKGLNINGDARIGTHPNRYKQHGFYFNADNCIACHACESACSEKNDLPPHLAFRSVGYVEGGTWPDYHRLNISMACNHCDDPVCLKGCPTRAYTKFAEYGAVLQDPDICFGCGYCTWVCPYNAPQLDPVKGHVEKCNMCVDRLEVGLKPACAAACLAGALDFGVIETKPAHRDQLEASIPGFPDPDITRPNIRFQQTRSLPSELTRPDSVPLRYVRTSGEKNGRAYQPQVRNINRGRAWNLKKLHSREDPLVFFTLATQAVVGAFLALFLGPLFGLELLAPAHHPQVYTGLLFALIGVQTAALAWSTAHLGKPHRFYRAFNNLRYSPVSREVAGIAIFYNLLLGYALLTSMPELFAWLPETVVIKLSVATGWGAAIAGPIALYFMHAIYRIPARPFWNHWQVLTSFYGNMFVLGALVVGLAYASVLAVSGQSYVELLKALSLPMIAGLLFEGFGLIFHARDLRRGEGEGAVSHYEQTTTFGYTYYLRNAGLAFGLLLVIALNVASVEGTAGLFFWILTSFIIVTTAVMGRALFYVLVIPTTMPGAFFWRNRGFEEHARVTGLAHKPQVGVMPDAH